MSVNLCQYNWTDMMDEEVAIRIVSTPKSSKLDLIANRIKVVIVSRKKYDVEARRNKIIDEMNLWYAERRHKILYDHTKQQLTDTPSLYHEVPIDTSPGSLAVLHDYYRFGSHVDQKFFRVQIQRQILDAYATNMFNTYEGLLIDVGEIVRFCRHELYPLEPQFMPMPPQVFTIKLGGLGAFEGTGRLGRVYESFLMHFGKDYVMKLKKAPTATSPPEVDLIKEGLGPTVNEYILMQICAEELGKPMVKCEGDRMEGCFINTIFPGGRIGVKMGSPVLKAIMKCLEEAQAGFDTLKLIQPEDAKKKGSKYVARHPETNKLERCQLVQEDHEELEEETSVEWIDFGGQSSINKLTELVRAEVVSPILDMAPGTYAVFRLHNIIGVRIAVERLNVFVRAAKRPVTLTIVEVPSTGPAKVLVHNEGAGGEEEIFNQVLIKRQLVTPADDPLNWTIPHPRILFEQLIWTMPVDLVAAEWALVSKEDPLKTLKVEAGQRVLVDIPLEDGQFVHCQKFRVRPSATKTKFEKLQREIRDYCVEDPWVAEERKFKTMEVLDGEFCVVEISEGEYRRARVCGSRIYQGFTHPNWQKRRYEVSVLDFGNVTSRYENDVIQVKNPWPLLSHLGPQAALAEWKLANEYISAMDGSPEERLKELSEKLQEKLGNGINVAATVTNIRKNQYGSNVIELAFDFDTEIECELMLSTFRIV